MVEKDPLSGWRFIVWAILGELFVLALVYLFAG